jgi:exodeoxyribonuclease III
MKILSWNVNGIRAIAKKGFIEWLKKESPDILCLQETKSQPTQLSSEILNPWGYKTYWSSAEKKGYSGVAVFSQKEPKSVSEGLGIKALDNEGRTLIVDYGNFILFNVYFPNGGSGNKRVPFKMQFYDAFLDKINRLKMHGKKIIICGDVNTAHTEIDLSRPKENETKTGFLPIERAWVTKLIDNGYIDTFRYFHKEPGH